MHIDKTKMILVMILHFILPKLILSGLHETGLISFLLVEDNNNHEITYESQTHEIYFVSTFITLSIICLIYLSFDANPLIFSLLLSTEFRVMFKNER